MILYLKYAAAAFLCLGLLAGCPTETPMPEDQVAPASPTLNEQPQDTDPSPTSGDEAG